MMGSRSGGSGLGAWGSGLGTRDSGLVTRVSTIGVIRALGRHLSMLAGPHPRSLRVDSLRSLAAAAGAADPAAVFISPTVQHGLIASICTADQHHCCERLNTPVNTPFPRTCPAIAVITAPRVCAGDAPTAGTSSMVSSA